MRTPPSSPQSASRGIEVSGPGPSRPPRQWRETIESVLISRAAIARRVRVLAEVIQRDFADREPVIVSVLNSTVMFVADLLRHLTLPVRLDFLGMSSYRDATSPGALRLTKDLGVDVRGRDVLLVDDILDTGQTLHHVAARLRRLRPRRLRICVLLEKQVPHKWRIRPHYTGFRIPDCFVVGYGLDYAERFRNLPFIGVLKRSSC